MKIIGLTGGIGTGKGVVASFLGSMGATVIDADRLGHEAYAHGTDGWDQVVKLFGIEILDSRGEIDRRVLAKIVFSDAAALQKLNGAIHPIIKRTIRTLLKDYEDTGIEVAVIEAAILLETGWNDLVDETWLVTAGYEAVVERVQKRQGLSRDQVEIRIRSQSSTEWKMDHADIVIDNSGTVEQLEIRIRHLWETRVLGNRRV